jgi:hypothetical protein
MDKVHDSMIGRSTESGCVGVCGWDNGTIDIHVGAMHGAATAEITIAQARELARQLSAAIAAVEASNAN